MAKWLIVDVSTGEERDDWQGLPLSYLMNPKSSVNRSFITWDYANSTVSALRLRNATHGKKSKSSGQAEIDPRYVRLLPWVVSAKGSFWEAGRAVLNYGWSRILKLALGVYLLPIIVNLELLAATVQSSSLDRYCYGCCLGAWAGNC